MSGDLTDEQRLRIQMNRQRALAKKRPQRQSTGTDGAANQHPRAIPPDNQTIRDKYSNHNSRSQSKPSRESFGESKIDWNNAINDMDKILASSEYSNIQRNNGPFSRDFFFTCDKVDSRKRKLDIGGGSTSVAKHLTTEQQARMEKNRLKVIERKQQGDTIQSEIPLLHSSSAKVNAHANEKNLSLTDEQRARIEFNRLKALETKKLEYCATQQLFSNLHDNTSLSTAERIQRTAILTEEQRSRIEENRRRALQKKHSKQSQSVSNPPQRGTTNNAVIGRKLHTNAEEAPQKTNPTQPEISAPPKPKQEVQNNASKTMKLADELQYEETRCMPIDDDHLEDLIENAELDKPLKNGWKLFDHQKEGILRALKMRRLILAFDMGLG